MKKVIVTLKTRTGDQQFPLSNIYRLKDNGKSCDVVIRSDDDIKVVNCIEPFIRIRARVDKAKELAK